MIYRILKLLKVSIGLKEGETNARAKDVYARERAREVYTVKVYRAKYKMMLRTKKLCSFVARIFLFPSLALSLAEMKCDISFSEKKGYRKEGVGGWRVGLKWAN
jgi:hypothetical protein